MPSAFQRLPLAALAFVACRPSPEAPPRAPVCVAEALAPAAPTAAASSSPDAAGLHAFIAANYTKQEVQIPMRDGVTLHTAIYAPKDSTRAYPILMLRTPYSCRPYGPDQFPNRLGPSTPFAAAGYIFVCQDVRGAYQSGGEFVDVRPHNPAKKTPQDIDESSDTFDTITWLLGHVAGHNGRVGLHGISYPGFYAAAGMIDAHPALRAVSPQAPIADFYFDDFHHHGAFFLPHAFNFYAWFGNPRPAPTRERNKSLVEHGTEDGYQYFLDTGPLKNLQPILKDVGFWQQIVAHPNRDEFWQARDLQPRLKNVAPAVLTVGGWYDPEDLHGPLAVYRAVERQNPGITNLLVMGPWGHGGWSRTAGDRLGDISFGSETAVHYQQHIELPFFEHHLKDIATPPLPEASVFETGTNQWRSFSTWPPPSKPRAFYFGPDETLGDAAPQLRDGRDEFISDPNKPVPFTQDIAIGMTREYMTDDQRFAARRPDVLVYESPPLPADVTVAGPIAAELWVSTSAGDADWIVKLIDVLPPDTETPADARRGVKLGGYQQMVRSEVLRGRFRDDYEQPRPFTPGKPTSLTVPLQDVLHTFKKGHRIMVQVQSTWFPLIDRNPQKYVDNIFLADEADFQRATHRVYRQPGKASRIVLPVLTAP